MFANAKYILSASAFAALTCFTMTGAAQAQDTDAATPQAKRTTETFGDWQVDCVTPPITEEKPDERPAQCEMHTQVSKRDPDGTQRPLIQVGIGQTGMAEGHWIVVQTPLNLQLKDGIKLFLLDSEKQGTPEPLVAAGFLYCEQTHCLAQGLIGKEQLDALAEADITQVQFVSISKDILDIPLSLEGFSDARAALKK